MIDDLSKTPGILLSEIELRKDNFNGSFFLVEGDTDSKFWRSRLNMDNCKIVITEGKRNAIGLSELLDQENDTITFGVIDSDFDKIFKRELKTWRLAVTDCHDLDVLLLNSPALNRFINERIEDNLLKEFEIANSKNILEILFEYSLVWGNLRYLNEVENYNVDFDKLKPYRNGYIDKKNLNINIENIYKDFCSLAIIDINELYVKIKNVPTTPKEDMIQGHDALMLLCIIFNSIKKNQKDINEKDLGSSLRLAFHFDDIINTKMYKKLKEIELNIEIKILP